MSAVQPPVGSRGNGLTAGGWTRVADCDPRLADELLSLLADAAIAACAAPSPGERGGYLEVRLPRRPVDRLYVDVSRREDAEKLVRGRLERPVGELTGPSSPSANDEAFDAIVAGWSITQVGDWPEAENVSPQPPRRRRTDAPSNPIPRRRPEAPDLLDPLGENLPRDRDPFEYDDNHYEPPPPPPVPRLRSATKMALLGIALGIACLVAVPLDWVTDAELADLLGGLLILGGVGSLVYHLHDEPRDDDSDDGAVV